MNVGFIGTGNMGSMLINALVSSGALKAEQIVAGSRSLDKVSRLSDALPGLQAGSNTEVIQRCFTVFLCTRPGQTAQVLADTQRYITDRHLLVVITNSIEIADLERAVGARVAKVIPSLAQAVGAGVSLLMLGTRATDEDRAWLCQLFSHISRPFVIPEGQARVAADLTSCGPAFLACVCRAMARAAHRCQPDLPAPTAEAMVLSTAVATAKLLTEADLSFDDVIGRVSTPGGITGEGIKVLEEHLHCLWEQVFETTIVKERDKKVTIDL